MASSHTSAENTITDPTIDPLSSTARHPTLPRSTPALTSSADADGAPQHSTSATSDSSSGSLNGSTQSSTDPTLPAHWTKYTHMHGGIYYSYHNHQLLTKEDVCNLETDKLLMNAYEEYRDWFDDLPDDAEMEIFLAEGHPHLRFASWSRGMLYGFEDDKDGLVSLGSPSFWDHAWSFPMHRTYLAPFMETQFLTALAFGSNQRVMDVKNTTFPFDDGQIERLMRVYRDLRGHRQSPVSPDLLPALCYHIRRAMFEIETARTRYGYGTSWARMYRDIAIPESTWSLAMWDVVLGVVMCGTHKNYRTRLYSTAPKGFISIPDFRRLMRNFMSEWADSNLVATVLVSVNVGFLALPNMSSLVRSFSLVSSLCAMTSIITGLHHVWDHREKTETEIEDARQYLYHVKLRCRRRPKNYQLTAVDLSPTACLLALPLATLQWSVVSFTVGIGIYAVQLTVFLYFWRIWLPPVHQELEEGFNPNVAVPPLPPHWEILRGRIAVSWNKYIRKGSMPWMVRMDALRRSRESV
ncbi:hypothetical protein B0H11DRAFT_2237783 [Mycena galericulata]|nr:hypothetical protein B0H11DRAFT_2237783 [Mycena galericulata]